MAPSASIGLVSFANLWHLCALKWLCQESPDELYTTTFRPIWSFTGFLRDNFFLCIVSEDSFRPVPAAILSLRSDILFLTTLSPLFHRSLSIPCRCHLRRGPGNERCLLLFSTICRLGSQGSGSFSSSGDRSCSSFLGPVNGRPACTDAPIAISRPNAAS